MFRNLLRRCVAVTTATLMTASIGFASARPASATDDFADAATSKIPYTKTLVESHVDCGTLTGRALTYRARVTVAKIVPATSTTPAYCDVSGVIAPSILSTSHYRLLGTSASTVLGTAAAAASLRPNFRSEISASRMASRLRPRTPVSKT